MDDTAVSDAGPLIHLSEVGRLEALRIVGKVLVPPEVSRELTVGPHPLSIADLERVEPRSLTRGGKDRASALCGRLGLDLGEAEAILPGESHQADLHG